MTRKEIYDALAELAEDAPSPYEERTLAQHQKTLDDFDERMSRVLDYANALRGCNKWTPDD